MTDSIQDKYETEIVFKAKENVTSEIQKIERSIAGLSESISTLSTGMFSLLGIMGIQGVSSLSHMATEVTEIQNRLELLNETVVNTGLSFKDLVHSATDSRTSLESFAEMFNRIGLTSGHYFTKNPEDLMKAVTTLNKQFQLMHLTPGQLMSVQTSILDAFELGYFDWRHLKAGMMHDSPLFRGYIKSQGLEGEDVTEMARNHQLTTEGFLEYILSTSRDVNEQFDKMTLTLSQFGNIMKNEIVDTLSGFLSGITKVVNMIYRGYQGLKQYAPHLIIFAKDILLATVGITALLGVGKMVSSMLLLWNILAMSFQTLTGGWMKLGAAIGILAGGLFFTDMLGGIKNIYGGNDPTKIDTNKELKAIHNIDKNVQSISNKMGMTRQSLNDLVTRTESLLIHNSFQNNFSLNGQYSERNLSEMIVNMLKRDLSVNGVRD